LTPARLKLQEVRTAVRDGADESEMVIFKIVNQLRPGVVWANTYNKFDRSGPFGGYKESGLAVKVDGCCRISD
jgi:acyl-CoA reductase-like NAD-dependent aldehyde dehydrogenase